MNSALIKKWMEENNVRAVDIASKLGISLSTVQKILLGQNPIRPTITVLAGLMGVSEADLMGPTKKVPVSKKRTGT